MKKLIITIFAFVLMLSLLGCNSNPKTVDENTTEETSTEIKYSQMHADWNYYDTADSLFNKATNVYEGKIVNIYFDVFDMKTGKTKDEVKFTEESYPMLYTIYEVEVEKTYKGDETEKQYFKIIGGLKDYKVDEQCEVMKEAGIYTSESGIVLINKSESHNVGEKYIFFTVKKVSNYYAIPNPDQFAFSEEKSSKNSDFGYKEVVKYLENGVAKAE